MDDNFKDELDELLSSLETTKPPEATPKPEGALAIKDNPPALSFLQWRDFCFDYIVYKGREQETMRDFGITEESFKEMMDNPLFSSLYQNFKKELVGLTKEQALQWKIDHAVQTAVLTLEDVMANGKDPDRVKAAETIGKWAGLDKKESQMPTTIFSINVSAKPIDYNEELIIDAKVSDD